MKSIAISLAITAMAIAHSQMTPDAARTALKSKYDQATAQKVGAIGGKDGWLFSVQELHYLTAGPFWGDAAAKVAASATNPDPLPAIVSFKKALEKKGIDLIVMPVPGKAAIYPDKLVDGAPTDLASRIDTPQADFLKLLSDNGIKTIDLTPLFIQHRADFPDQALYAKQDTHWSNVGIQIAADAVASEIKKESWYPDAKISPFTTSPLVVEAPGDLVSILGTDPKPGNETFHLTKVNGIPSEWDRTSPLVVLGDSHNLIYSTGDDMIATGAGFPENLTQRIGFVPDVLGVKGSGSSLPRSLARRGSIAGKKTVVWLFTAREFTESLNGWRMSPEFAQ